jgi:hypothetical protein
MAFKTTKITWNSLKILYRKMLIEKLEVRKSEISDNYEYRYNKVGRCETTPHNQWRWFKYLNDEA